MYHTREIFIINAEQETPKLLRNCMCGRIAFISEYTVMIDYARKSSGTYPPPAKDEVLRKISGGK
jgi:hypothetical protein